MFKTNLIGFGNETLVGVGNKLLHVGLLAASVGAMLLYSGSTWYAGEDEKAVEGINILSKHIEN